MSDDRREIWPLGLRLSGDRRTLTIEFDSGENFALAAELLRVESPSAEVKGHGPGQEVLVAGKRQVAITALEPVGNYAVRIRFDDGHSTGLYTWDYLARVGRQADGIWQDYLSRLAAASLSRDAAQL